MPPDDKTPPGYMLPTPSPVERWVKVRLRHILYPSYLRLVNVLLRRHYEPLGNLGVDQWYWGDRGLEYSRQRMKNPASLTEVAVNQSWSLVVVLAKIFLGGCLINHPTF